HGGFAIGLGLLGLILVGEAIDAVHERALRSVWPLALTTVASIATTLVNPNGVAGLLYPLTYVAQTTGGQALISEWQPPDLLQLAFAPFGLSLLLAVALGLRGPPLRSGALLAALAFTVLALQSV